MAAKAGKAVNKGELQEDILQAVVIADSFNQRYTLVSLLIARFMPLTARGPRTLLPLVNIPLLDYTIEFLTSSGVQEIFVFCCAFSEQIKEHIAKSRWSKLITPIVSQGCSSIGEALREIDRHNVIQNNFILVIFVWLCSQ